MALNAGPGWGQKENQMEKLVYGDTSLDFDALSDASRFALAQRGLTHVLGNEIASKVHSWAGQAGQANSDDKATIKAWKDANVAAITSKTAELVADTIKALNDGTLGARVGGPRLTPIDTLRRQIAKGQIETILRANKIKVPTKDDTVKMPDGEFTMTQLVERRLAMQVKDASGAVIRDIGAEITKEAEKELALRAKKQAALVAGAAEALGGL